jgi:hypothetical protein
VGVNATTVAAQVAPEKVALVAVAVVDPAVAAVAGADFPAETTRLPQGLRALVGL